MGFNLPANAESDGDQLGVRGDGGGTQAVGLRCDGGGKHVEVAGLDKELHFAGTVDAAHAVDVAAANVPATLVGGEMAHHLVCLHVAATVKVITVNRQSGVGKAGHLAVEAAATSEVEIVRGLGK